MHSGLNMSAYLLRIITRRYSVTPSAVLDPYLYVSKLANLVVRVII